MVLYELITNKMLVIPVCAWAIAQLIKVFVILARERRLDLHYFVASGGMPSSHTALVCALATAAAITQGLNSVAFAITAILAMVVTYDAAGVRQSVSKQSIILNRIVKEFRIRRPKGELEHDLREFIGHTPFQVIVGAILGILVAWLWLTISTL
ncbi:MAG: divergent PAP2 family protein [Dehalococcoidales bacterium]|nr:divergent PAP2 family protein [Dehalococcoidales bacterium]